MNLTIKKVNIKFLGLPNYIRLPARLALFTFPFAMVYEQIDSKIDIINRNFADIEMKIKRLERTGNMKQYMEADIMMKNKSNESKK